MIRKMLKHVKIWNEWRKNSLNGAGHKFFVLIGVRKSPTFEFFKISRLYRLTNRKEREG